MTYFSNSVLVLQSSDIRDKKMRYTNAEKTDMILVYGKC